MKARLLPFGAALVAAAACSSDPADDASSGDGGTTTTTSGGGTAGGGTGGGSAAGGSGGAGGEGSCLDDPCRAFETRTACCGVASCAWQHQTGHLIHGVAPCVHRDRICVVAGEEVRACPDGQTCMRQGAYQDTADDCTLPEPGMTSLLDRGICVCE